MTSAAVVIGGGTNGLGIVRALGKKGISVYVVDSSPKRLAMLSRYATANVFDASEGTVFVDELIGFLSNFLIPPVLFVTEEAPLMSISESRERLSDLCKILLPPHNQLVSLMSKQGIDSIAETIGFVRPKTVHLSSMSDVERVRELRFPCVLKPGNKTAEYAVQFQKGYKILNYEQALKTASEILPVLPDLVIQEWVEGGDRDIYFCLVFISNEGEVISAFTGRKLRCWPIPVGGTASCGPAPEFHEELLSQTLTFFSKAGFVGIGGVEYKRDPRDGQFYLIEPTVARTDFQHEVAVLNGVNIPYSVYCYHEGLNYSPEPLSKPYAWIEPVTERWARDQSGVPDKDIYSGLTKVNSLFRWYDPAPWVASIIIRLRARLRSIGLNL